MKKTMLALLLGALTITINAGVLIQTEPHKEKTAWVGEEKDLKFEKTEFARTNGVAETYQWFDANTFQPIADGTNRVLTLASVTPADSTYYIVMVSDGTTTEFSALLALTVKEEATLINQVYYPESGLTGVMGPCEMLTSRPQQIRCPVPESNGPLQSKLRRTSQ